MPLAPPRPCKHPGCPETTRHHSGYCPKHRQEYNQGQRRRRDNRQQRDPFYSTSRWQKLRQWYKRQHPMCEDCGQAPAVMVHHIVPIKDGGDPMAVDNLKALCRDCHNYMHKKKKA